MRHYLVLVAMFGLLILIQHKFTRNAELFTTKDDRPRRRSAKDHTLRLVSEDYKTGVIPAYQLPISKAKAKLKLTAYTIQFGYTNALDFMGEYFSFQCSIHNKKIPRSLQHVNVGHTQSLVDRVVKRLPVNKKGQGKEILSVWVDACLEYGNTVAALSKTHAKEWNDLINTRLLNIRIYSKAKGHDERNQLLINAVIDKDTINFKNDILKLSRKQQKEIYCLSPPKVLTDLDIAFKPINNHFNDILSKLFGNTQYCMAKYLDEVLDQVLTMATTSHFTGADTKFMFDKSVSVKFSLLEKSLEGIWVDIPNSVLPSHHSSDPWQLFLNILQFVWTWLCDLLKKCLDNENEEKKKLIFDGVDFNI
ncbi:uncharacterized protein EV154DRAFT_488466 [Mucor mucedo]|uniref:uncharacterized protein n=1 Tax=Mucor mucedo TaxID=29922 RepID=UPI00222083C2|nr:uncharacterized protein EV154DRAFT_488466 [Mucor mucedo]KAI7866915.1 hypothetical protein EV154DRAFT_488466 [Mucor mucedo]